MDRKYVMIDGMAFSEESDMSKLKKYAKEGWILEDIVGGFFYKLKKDKPKDMDYSLDYQCEADEEYFSIFLEAGWTRVVSIGNEIHIFSAPEGTKPIYNDSESEVDKYVSIKMQTKKGTIYSLIATIILATLLPISAMAIRPIFLVVFSLFIVSIIVFIFNFMPYLAYNYRLNKLRKKGKWDKESIFNIKLWKLYAFSSICFSFVGTMNLLERKYFFAGCFILLGVFSIIETITYYKKK